MFSQNRNFGYSARRDRKNVLKNFLIVFILLFVTVCVWLYIKNAENLKRIMKKPSNNEIIEEMWQNGKYSDLIRYCEGFLEEYPDNFDVMMFRGFASFYQGASFVNLEEQLPFMDAAVFYLRKAVLFENEKMRPQIDYVLGKAYYHKGKYYNDLSVKYLESAVARGYTGTDIWEYLALAYGKLGNREKSAEYFEVAVKVNPSDILFSLLAQIYIDMDNFEKAEEYLLMSNNKTSNPKVEEKNLFLLGQIYENKNDLIKTEECYRKIIEINPRSADAFYKLGLLYEKEKDSIKARSEWRKALRIDPEHYGVRLKLFG